SGCPQLHRPAATGSAAKVSHLLSNHSASRRTHDLRHTCASLLLAQGVSPRVVMDVLGHSQLSITMDLYSHVMPSALRDAADAMDRALNEGR
ncbi:MAG TPA: tyrosine-type recombinase/integrase, partial [Propionibacteriaceae bacterium]|nr:tyrosine-type recombinase/integrase [Propionibacteriaceae bacterium]